MRYHVLACDYDGTIAHHGIVDDATLSALERFKASGRRLLLVTGRELDDLMRVHPDLTLFDRVVFENGAAIHNPATRETVDLAAAPPPAFASELARRGVAPLSTGRVIVATWRPHEHVVFETIRDLGLELQVIFNKDAVMVLPSGVNKATGLAAALADLGISQHNTIGVGDAENDHAFLRCCECSVAVANAVPALKAHADYITIGDHGAGVAELVDRALASDLEDLEPVLVRHEIPLGSTEDGVEVRLRPYGEAVMIAGESGTGKSTIARLILERLAAARYQFCVVDPEGDYQELPSAVALRGQDERALTEEALQLLGRADQNLVLSLTDTRLEDRPGFFQRFLPLLKRLDARTGRPHWLTIDEAHHLFPLELQAGSETLTGGIGGLLMITVHPEHLSPAARGLVKSLIVVGRNPAGVARAFAGDRPFPTNAPPPPDRPGRWACLFRTGEDPVWVSVPPPLQDRQRHRRKYAEGELGEDKSFYFRGPDGRLNLRAQNLALFSQLAMGVDDETWSHHLATGDYERWFEVAIGDEELAAEAARVREANNLSAAESRAQILSAIQERYTAPS